MQINAATTTANTDSDCTAITPFDWEIGDVHGALASGTAGGNLFGANTAIEIASASKMWWGAYLKSVDCGRKIRMASATGVAQ